MAPELTVTDGMPPPTGLPDGEFWATRLPDGSLRIDRADPSIMIAEEVLNEAIDRPAPYVTYTAEPDGSTVLKIHGVNRTVIYRITGYVPRVRGYTAEWPD